MLQKKNSTRKSYPENKFYLQFTLQKCCSFMSAYVQQIVEPICRTETTVWEKTALQCKLVACGNTQRDSNACQV